MIFDDDVLNRLTPTLHWKPDWTEVLERAGEIDPRRRQPWARRRLMLALTVLAAVLIVLASLGVASEWRLFRG
ncbi:MAG: hypothetical protein WBQ14_03785 [Gaiellaceae bacterium]